MPTEQAVWANWPVESTVAASASKWRMAMEGGARGVAFWTGRWWDVVARVGVEAGGLAWWLVGAAAQGLGTGRWWGRSGPRRHRGGGGR